MEELDLRKMVREEIKKIQEDQGLIDPPQKNMDKEKTSLRKNMIQLLQHIEAEEYSDGIGVIEKLTSGLNSWKKRLERIV